MTYSLINKCAKNYYNRTFIVQVIAKNVVTCFFLRHSVVLFLLIIYDSVQVFIIVTLLYIQVIFDRVWRHWKSADELKVRGKLADMVNSSSPPKRLPTFNEVIVKCQSMLEKVMSGRSTPFLLEISRHVCNVLEMERRANNERSSGSSTVSSLGRCNVRCIIYFQIDD